MDRFSPTFAVARDAAHPVEGCLGALLIKRATGRYYAMTAAQLVDVRRRDLRASAQKVSLSVPGTLTRLTEEPDQAATAMIAAVPLRNHWVDGDHRAHHVKGRNPRVARPADLDGDHVAILGRSRPVIQARLARFNSAFSMPHPKTGVVTVFDNSLELHGPQDEKLLARGDAGALVVDHNGDWLGVIIGAKGNVAFAAPLYDLVTAMGLCVPSGQDIKRQNELIDTLVEEDLERAAREARRVADFEEKSQRRAASLTEDVSREVREGSAQAKVCFA